MGLPAEKNQKYSYKDYLLTPEDERYELIEGNMFMVPAPSTRHQYISGRIYLAIHHFLSAPDRGEVFYAPCDVVLDDNNVVQPDLLVISKERAGIVTEANIQGAPDLVVEIVSPSSAYHDLVKKKKLYARFGVKEYWLVDPEEKTVEVHLLEDGAYSLHQALTAADTLECATFKGLKVKLAEVFS